MTALSRPGDDACVAGVPLVEAPPPGDEAALVSVLARILVDLCSVEAGTVRAPAALSERAEAA